MDFSKQYILMCKRATPDLGREIPSTELAGLIEGEILEKNLKTYIKADNDLVQLYRQDQLQEMLIKDYDKLEYLSDDFNRFLLANSRPTFEQNWLAFIMKEKYSKTWNGENWV